MGCCFGKDDAKLVDDLSDETKGLSRESSDLPARPETAPRVRSASGGIGFGKLKEATADTGHQIEGMFDEDLLRAMKIDSAQSKVHVVEYREQSLGSTFEQLRRSNSAGEDAGTTYFVKIKVVANANLLQRTISSSRIQDICHVRLVVEYDFDQSKLVGKLMGMLKGKKLLEPLEHFQGYNF